LGFALLWISGAGLSAHLSRAKSGHLGVVVVIEKMGDERSAERNPPLRGASNAFAPVTGSRRGARPHTWLGPPVPVVLIHLRWQGLPLAECYLEQRRGS